MPRKANPNAPQAKGSTDPKPRGPRGHDSPSYADTQARLAAETLQRYAVRACGLPLDAQNLPEVLSRLIAGAMHLAERLPPPQAQAPEPAPLIAEKALGAALARFPDERDLLFAPSPEAQKELSRRMATQGVFL